jgi:hypothetical protein
MRILSSASVLLAIEVAIAALLAARAHASELAPLEMVDVAPGDYVFAGSVALMNQQNIGAIANIGFVVGP